MRGRSGIRRNLSVRSRHREGPLSTRNGHRTRRLVTLSLNSGKTLAAVTSILGSAMRLPVLTLPTRAAPLSRSTVRDAAMHTAVAVHHPPRRGDAHRAHSVQPQCPRGCPPHRVGYPQSARRTHRPHDLPVGGARCAGRGHALGPIRGRGGPVASIASQLDDTGLRGCQSGLGAVADQPGFPARPPASCDSMKHPTGPAGMSSMVLA